MTIRPIRTERDHKEALAAVERLWDARPGSREYDELDLLGTLVDAYEREHRPIPPPDPVAAILFRLEQLGLSRKDLEPLIGKSGRVSEVLTRKRPLTLAMIRRLHRELEIPLEALVAAPERPRRRRSPTRKFARTSQP